jgi:opacity protein-like surface antigen
MMAGYGATFWNWLYLGAEVEATGSSATAKDKISSGKHEISKDWGAGASLRIGTTVADSTLIYGRLGWQMGHFGIASNRTGDSPVSSFSGSKSLHGLTTGLGVDYAMSSNWLLRADWTYTMYQSWSYTDSAGNTARVKPRENQLRLGVAYKF